MPLFICAQTQYDYYDDDSVAGGVDVAVSSLIIIVGLVLAFFVLAFIGNGLFSIYYWFNPEADPEYKKKMIEKRRDRENAREMNAQNKKRTIPVEEKEQKEEVYAPQIKKNVRIEGDRVHVNNVSPNTKEQVKHQITRANNSPMTNIHQKKVFEELHFKAPSERELSHLGWSTDKYGVRYSKDGRVLYSSPDLLFTEYEVKEGTEIICDEAFHSYEKCSQLKVLKLPDTVKYIGNLAFCGNSYLETIELSKNLIYIGDYSFAACRRLQFVVLPESLRHLGQGCFRDCDWKEFIIPRYVESIKGNPMKKCAGTIYESNSPYYIKENNCIYSCDKKTIIVCEKEAHSSLLDGVSHIAGGAFMNGWFEKMEIPATIVSIGDYAFYDCRYLKSVTIPNSVKKIGAFSFYDSAIFTVNIPDSVIEIGKVAFGFCQKLTKISLPTSIKSICDSTFENCYSIEEIEIPIHVEDLGNSAFRGCCKLREIILPNALKSIGDYTFKGCKQLEQITIPPSVSYIGKNPFVNCRCKVKSLSNHFIIKNGLLLSSDMKSIISCLYDSEIIDIPPGVESIGDSAFYNCSNIVHIGIPNTLKTIGRFAFSDCRLLKSISIPKSVQKIENSSFMGCQNLEVFRIFNKDIDIDPFQIFRDCDSLKAIQIPRGSFRHFHMIFEDYRWAISLLKETTIKKMKETAES